MVPNICTLLLKERLFYNGDDMLVIVARYEQQYHINAYERICPYSSIIFNLKLFKPGLDVYQKSLYS
jgi:hypothetical protein